MCDGVVIDGNAAFRCFDVCNLKVHGCCEFVNKYTSNACFSWKWMKYDGDNLASPSGQKALFLL